MVDDEGLIAGVLAFWKDAGTRGLWFGKDEDFDRCFRERFLELHIAAAARRLDGWMETPDGALALLILLDQFPRNAFRGTAHMFATDPLARRLAREAQSRGHMEHVDAGIRVFFCLPFSHSEDLVDQELAVALNERLGQPWLAHALEHRDIVRRFGRFPHRNALLGRDATTEEAEFLADGGFAG